MRSKLLWILAVAALAGCPTSLCQPPSGQSWDVSRPQLQARDRFERKGRVAVALGAQGFNARLRWVQDGARSQVVLQGPRGAGGMQVTADGPHLSIITSHGERLDSDAARTELTARRGFEPPLDSLRYWILGVPDPARPATEALDTQQQRLESLRQSGWQIDYGG